MNQYHSVSSVSYLSATSRVVVNITPYFMPAEGDAVGDTYASSVTTVYLSNHDDWFVTIGGSTEVFGGAGNDVFMADNSAFNYHGGSEGTVYTTAESSGDAILFWVTGGGGWSFDVSTDGSYRLYNDGTGWKTLLGTWDNIETIDAGPNSDILRSIGGDGKDHQLIGDPSPNPYAGAADIIIGSMLSSELYSGLSDNMIGGPGGDTFYLGYRLNHIDYEVAISPVSVSIMAGGGTVGDAAGDVFIAPSAPEPHHDGRQSRRRQGQRLSRR